MWNRRFKKLSNLTAIIFSKIAVLWSTVSSRLFIKITNALFYHSFIVILKNYAHGFYFGWQRLKPSASLVCKAIPKTLNVNKRLPCVTVAYSQILKFSVFTRTILLYISSTGSCLNSVICWCCQQRCCVFCLNQQFSSLCDREGNDISMTAITETVVMVIAVIV